MHTSDTTNPQARFSQNHDHMQQSLTHIRDLSEQLSQRPIQNEVLDRISQRFHFDDFFAPQIEAFNQLSEPAQTQLLNDLSSSKDADQDDAYRYFRALSDMLHTKRFTSFNSNMFQTLLQDLQPDLIVDPCMGWGHRMLVAMGYEIPYKACDIRSESVDNNQDLYQHVTRQIGHRDVALQLSDGVDFIKQLSNVPEHSLLFTCPPYHDAEIYSSDGIENATYDEFLNWWQAMAKASFEAGIETFAFQITPNYGQDMVIQAQAAGYALTRVIENTRKPSQTLHVNTRGVVAKRQYGVIYVLERVSA